jgi:hypothetical protein
LIRLSEPLRERFNKELLVKELLLEILEEELPLELLREELL